MIDPHPEESAEAPDGTLAVPGCRFQHDAMACTFEVYIVGPDARYAQQAAWAAFDELDRLEQILSRFVPHSDIARLSALEPGQSIPVSAETIECLQLAAQLYTETKGAFDITFRTRRGTPTTTSPDALTPLVLDPVQHTVGTQVAGVVLDLGGLGKGYAVDRMVAVLREWGIDAGLVHGGQSTVYALGRPLPGSGWHVGLRCPDRPVETLGRLPLRDSALSGSGQLLHGQHIIDPRPGGPANANQAAWAVAPTAAVADGLSTAFMLLSSEEVEALCGRRDDVSAILVPAACARQEVLCFGAQSSLLSRGGGAC